MATLTNSFGIVELAKRTENKDLLEIAEVLAKTNEVLQDAVWVEANGILSHSGTIRTNLPAGSWRRFNSGVAVEASQTEKVTENIGSLESFSQIDEDLVKIAPDPQRFRSDEDLAFVEGLSQTWADTLLTGDRDTDPDKFHGLQPRYNALSNANVIDGGGAGNTDTSMWLVGWGRKRVHMIYPRGHQTLGLEREDLGVETVTDANGKLYRAYRTHFKFWGGLFVHDTRYVKRICNIDLATIADLDDLMIEALNKMPSRDGLAFYCNTALKTVLDIMAKDKSNVNYQPGEMWGQPVTMFQGVPVRRWDSIGTSESQVT